MRMVLLHIGSHIEKSDTVMLALAALFGIVIGPFWARRLEGIEPRTTFGVHVLFGFAALAGARLHFLSNYPMLNFGGNPWRGIHASGAIVGMLIAAPAIFAFYRIHPGRMADAIIPATGVGIFIARIGCFLNGCCFGVPCPYPWCLSFPPGSLASVVEAQQKVISYESWSLPVHPLQLYFAFTGLAITLVALWLIPRKRYHGQVAMVAVLIFALAAYWLEPFRQGTGFRPYVNGMPQLQVVAGWLVRAAVAGLLVCEVGHRLLARWRVPAMIA